MDWLRARQRSKHPQEQAVEAELQRLTADATTSDRIVTAVVSGRLWVTQWYTSKLPQPCAYVHLAKMPLNSLQVSIDGMHCASCSSAVEKALKYVSLLLEAPCRPVWVNLSTESGFEC